MHKKVCKNLIYVELLRILASTVTRCVSISACVFLVDIPVGIASSTATIKICVITAGSKK